MITNLARTHQRPTSFGLNTQFTTFSTPHTEFRVFLSKGSQILTQRMAKGKKIDTSANPIFRWRRLALHHHQLVKIFNKGYASMVDRAAIHDHLLTLNQRSGLSPFAKAHYRLECEDSTFEVGTILPGSAWAYFSSALENSSLVRVQSDFFYSWPESFVIKLPYLSIHFVEFIPPSYNEVQALRETANALLRQNRLLMQRNE